MTQVRVPIVGSPTNRSTDSTKDQRFVNCFPEVVQNSVTQAEQIFLLKRNGTTVYSNPPATTGEGRGIATFNNKLYSVIGNKLYSNTTAIQTLTTSTGAVGFELFTAANDYLILLDGTKGYYISTTDVVTEITDAQFPTPHIPAPVFMDGYLFVQKTDGSLFNSDSGDVTSWAATSYLTPESYPDGVVTLARQNNMVVALGVYSVEFFYDAANAAPGSPLSRNDQAILQYGCASVTSVAQEEGLLTFVAQSVTGEKFVVALEGTKDQNISTEAINRIIAGEGTSIGDCWGFITRQKGHMFYVLNLPSQSRTLVFDFMTKMWHEWDWYDGATYGVFPMIDAVEFGDVEYFLHQADGKIYSASPSVYQDGSNNIRVQIQTGKYDGDTGNIKLMSRLELIGDWHTATSPVSLYWNDSDYQGTWVGPYTLDLNARPYMYRLGSFRRRAFKLLHTANTPLRLSAFEFELEKGVH